MKKSTLLETDEAITSYYYSRREELLLTVQKAIKETDVVLDIGCGIRPMNYFKPKLHILAEPCKEYVDILTYQNTGDKSKLILQQYALAILQEMANNSVDSIFLLDVIEHIAKEEGYKIIAECERVAREQIIIFTPLGFMPQHIEEGNLDAWGLNGGDFQKHLSGWIPNDFDFSWAKYICKNFHSLPDAVESSNQFGAFFAIKNFDKINFTKPQNLSNITIPFFSALDAQQFHQENILLHDEIKNLQQHVHVLEDEVCDLQLKADKFEKLSHALQVAYEELLNSRSVKLTQFIKKFLGKNKSNASRN